MLKNYRCVCLVPMQSLSIQENRFFPDRHNPFHFINQPLAGRKRFASVRRDNFHPKRGFIGPDQAHAMNQPQRLHRPALRGDEIERRARPDGAGGKEGRVRRGRPRDTGGREAQC